MKKLKINKETIVKLNQEQMNTVRGGDLMSAQGCSITIHCQGTATINPSAILETTKKLVAC